MGRQPIRQVSRRQFLASAATFAGMVVPGISHGQGTRTRLILFGTHGGPRPRAANSASAQVVVANGAAHVIDCGDGVARQLAFAGVALPTIRHVFLTHQHSDHTADYGNLSCWPGPPGWELVWIRGDPRRHAG
jgi:phosphoribosyl 1,2-cyclic phosphodiesterase